ncbi:Transcriptional coregulator psa-3 [Caenorhabditis elegans]|uniref:Isoform b of Transcriptional coregulator psa-3 n=1 Tax=Caenorhabditis elegans TaxID=6239 RepID=Q0G825-2|nr:Transcriptional coregulator psa-3 [Caenorhabditis elegans]AAZ23152.1 hox cofactor PSA-3 splice variant beta [Caenorhabditis elegans]CAL36514.1 Transcriptional coregulator psa-3 [Caenorhabditis elegans]|eukprot:NP_001076766.1 Phasmid Socket Absent [Caenorhabditis elegans]
MSPNIKGISPTATNIKSPKKSALFEKIASHPLMPIVELLLEKCETAATTFDRKAFETDDIKRLFQSLEQRGVQLSSNRDEVDELMETAILALRTCMVELERVYSLMESFKAKYLATLRRTVCHEALVGNNGDSDDELSDNPLMPVLEMSEAAFQAQNKAMESALATLQSVSGSLSLPLQFTHQSITAAQIERNLEFLKQCGFPTQLPPNFLKPSNEKSPEKSEEEKSQKPSSSPKSPSLSD